SGRARPVSARGRIFLDEQMFILLARADFRLLAQGSAVPKPAPAITAVFDPRYFPVDSRNENLPNKRIHQNHAWIAVPVRPFSSTGHRRGMIACAIRLSGGRAFFHKGDVPGLTLSIVR